jgi:hypothetical protein
MARIGWRVDDSAGWHSGRGDDDGQSGGGTWFLLAWSIFAVVIGATDVLHPQFAFRVNRWQYKNKQAFEPSTAGLVVARIGGAVFVVIGIVCFVIAVTKL